MCLMALDKAEAVPVDTHVWNIARQRYGAALGARSLTARVHQEIGEGTSQHPQLGGARAEPPLLALISPQVTSSVNCGAPTQAGRRQ